jgi:hypothetical protein
VVALALLLGASSAHALGPLESTRADATRAVRLDTGIDQGLTAFAAYAHRLPFVLPLALEVRAGLPLVAPDPIDSELSIGAEITWLTRGPWQLRHQLDLFERTTENSIFTAFEVGARTTLRGGYFAPGWFLAGELGWEQGFATYIAHGDWYRETAYPDAEDGWLANPAGILETGLVGGGQVTSRLLLAGRLGLEVDRTGRTSFLPLVATFSAGWSF